MQRYLRFALLFFGGLALVPLLVGLVGAFDFVGGFLLGFFGLATALLALLIAVPVFVVHGVRCAAGLASPWRKLGIALASPVLAVLALLLAAPALALGAHLGDLLVLGQNRARYDAIVAAARAAPASEIELRGSDYVVDRGPPLRVAFEGAGVGDNWSGVVFDPSGEVLRAEGFDEATGRLRGPPRIIGLFGGDLVGCRHLWGDYYKCSFT